MLLHWYLISDANRRSRYPTILNAFGEDVELFSGDFTDTTCGEIGIVVLLNHGMILKVVDYIISIFKHTMWKVKLTFNCCLEYKYFSKTNFTNEIAKFTVNKKGTLWYDKNFWLNCRINMLYLLRVK